MGGELYKGHPCRQRCPNKEHLESEQHQHAAPGVARGNWAGGEPGRPLCGPSACGLGEKQVAWLSRAFRSPLALLLPWRSQWALQPRTW